MSSTVVFWFGWFWKALLSLPAFLGNNWVGAFFACACVFFYERQSLYGLESFRAATGTSEKLRVLGDFLMEHWKRTVKLWTWILLFFWIGHTLDLVRQNNDSLGTENITLSATNSKAEQTCTNQKTDLRIAAATEKTRADTLSTQNRDQQTSINNCQTEAVKLLTPIPQKTIPVLFEAKNFNGGAHFDRYVVLTNKSVDRVRIEVKCNLDFRIEVSMFAEEAGRPYRLPNLEQVSSKFWVVRIDSPAWTPENPILLNIWNEAPTATKCTFEER
jgi:hypothetical protein